MRTAPGASRAMLAAFAFATAAASALAAPVVFSADSVQSSLAKGRERTILTGRAKVRTGSISISADRIELFGKDFVYLDCSGKVIVVDDERQIRLEAPSLYYDRDKKLTRAQGPSVLQDDRNKLVLKAEWIENNGENEVTLAQVAVRILKGKLACRAEYALYRRKDNALELSGSPSAYRDGDEYRAARILVNTETEDIALEGEVSGSVTDKSTTDKKAAEEGAAAPDKAPPAAAAPDAPAAPDKSARGGTK
jgi:lipopolysaccharide export system protein LptA